MIKDEIEDEIEDILEPDSAESKHFDDFFEAITAADEAGVASSLRSLESLEGFQLVLLADLLKGHSWYGKNFPRLILVKRRGRPKKKIDILKLKGLGLDQATSFFKGIAEGNASKAAKALRKLKTLNVPQLKHLADLFDVDVALQEPFSSRLELRRRRAGKPVNRFSLENYQKEFRQRRIVYDALAAHPGRKKDAEHEVQTKTGKSLTTVRKMMKTFAPNPKTN
jgi:hypothetical protein